MATTSESDESRIIELDVGGTVYKTTKQTLLSGNDSYFSALFGGNWTVSVDKNGRTFVDRDGEPFLHVLEYLRNKDEMVLPKDPEMQKRVHREATFYGMIQLKEMVETALDASETSDDVIELNVGGVLFTTTKETLRSEGQFFRNLLSKKGALERKYKNGILFIDRDGAAFEHILRYLQLTKDEFENIARGHLSFRIKDEDLMQRVKQEARFFGINSLLSYLVEDADVDEYGME